MIEYFEDLGYVINNAFYYEGMPSKNSYFHRNKDATLQEFDEAKKAKRKYFNKLYSFGFKVRHKPVRRIFDPEVQQYKFKCNFDVELTMDVMNIFFGKRTDVFILCSGDGDFFPLAAYLKGNAKKIIVIGLKEHTNEGLMKVANKLIFLDKIKEKIEYKSKKDLH